jgi:RNA recognition motif-containing protein
MKIYVGNLSYEVSSEDLKEAFSEFGEVSSADVLKDKYSGRSRGFGFVEMASKEEGQKAIEALNGKELKDRAIKVNEARPRQDKPRGGKNFGGRGGRGGHGGYSGGNRNF